MTWLFRYGAVNQDVLEYLGRRGYEGVIMWSGGCIDWFFHDYARELPVYINGMADAGEDEDRFSFWHESTRLTRGMASTHFDLLRCHNAGHCKTGRGAPMLP